MPDLLMFPVAAALVLFVFAGPAAILGIALGRIEKEPPSESCRCRECLSERDSQSRE